MPSFYPRHSLPQQLLTPPEFVPGYQSGCGANYPHNGHVGQPPARQQEDGYDFAERYSQLAIAMPPLYPQAGTYLSSAPPSSFYEQSAATVLAPIHLPPAHAMTNSLVRQQPPPPPAHGQPAKEEKPVGGVSAKLDYDMDVMTDFVCDTALRLITPGRMRPASFRKWVHQVLCATRLPSATILLSMFYLSDRMPMLAGEPKTDSHLFRLLTIALVLGSKFLDDNTFINRSWSEVSGIRVDELNTLEMEWLNAIHYQLHRDPLEQRGWHSWSDHWTDYQNQAAVRASRTANLAPIDTSVQRSALHPHKPLPPLPMSSTYNPPSYEYPPESAAAAASASASYHPPTYTPYDPWRANSDHSPASAPTTGPTTPEYYGPASSWSSMEGYSRRTMFGFPPASQPGTMPSQSNYLQSAYPPYSTSAWNQHGPGCGCSYCAQRHPPFYMSSGYGRQAVSV